MMHCLCFTGNLAPFSRRYNEGGKRAAEKRGWRFQSWHIEYIWPCAPKGPRTYKGDRRRELASIPLPATRLGARAVMQQFINMLCCSFSRSTPWCLIFITSWMICKTADKDFPFADYILLPLLFCKFIVREGKGYKIDNYKYCEYYIFDVSL